MASSCFHEVLRGHEDHHEGGQSLCHHGPSGRGGGLGLELQRFEVLFAVLLVAFAADLAPEVHGVGGEERQAEGGFEGEGHEAEGDLDDEDRQEPLLVLGEPLHVLGLADGLPAGRLRRIAGGHAGVGQDRHAFAVPLDQEHAAGHAVGDGGQGEGAAHRRPDTDVLRFGGVAGGHRDQGDHGFGQCGAEGGQDRADRHLPHVQALTEPFDRVDEPLAREVDRHRTHDEQDEMDHGSGPSFPHRGLEDGRREGRG